MATPTRNHGAQSLENISQIHEYKKFEDRITAVRHRLRKSYENPSLRNEKRGFNDTDEALFSHVYDITDGTDTDSLRIPKAAWVM